MSVCWRCYERHGCRNRTDSGIRTSLHPQAPAVRITGGNNLARPVFVRGAGSRSGHGGAVAGARGGHAPMRSGIKIVRLGALLVAFLALSAMAGCPQSPEVQNSRQRTDGPADHSGSGGGMGHATAGGMGGGMGMP